MVNCVVRTRTFCQVAAVFSPVCNVVKVCSVSGSDSPASTFAEVSLAEPLCLTLQAIPFFRMIILSPIGANMRRPKNVKVQPFPMPSTISCKKATARADSAHLMMLLDAWAAEGESWLISTNSVLFICLQNQINRDT